MRFGIKSTPEGTVCANCGKLISKDDVYVEKFCSNCGNPIKAVAAKAYEAEIERIVAERMK